MRQPLSALSGTELFSIHQVNHLPDEQKLRVYRRLVPHRVLRLFGIDPETLADSEGRRLVEIECPSGTSSVELVLRHAWNAQDPTVFLQIADTPNNQIEVLLFIINDPHAERFDTDRLPDGTPTYFGTLERNVAEEVRAMKAGLAPGQVRAGLSLTRRLIPTLEQFVTGLHHDAVYIQPLAYHNAILFERLGFSYMLGLGRMEWIHKEFAPGGLLFGRLDGSTPFRQPGAESNVRGRSWAIHDGILGEPYTDVKMYKRVGVHAGVVTFPNAVW